MKKVLMLILLAIGGLSLSACSNSSNVFDFVLDESYTEYVTMATSADYPPYENIVQDAKSGKNTVAGVDIEIAKAIARALGKNLRVINKGFDFLIEDVRSGKVDFIIAAMTPTPSRELIVDFSKSYYTEATVEQVVLIKNTNVGTYQSIEDLNQATVRVGAQTGSIQAEFAELFTPLATKKIVQDLNQLMSDLNNGQIDALFTEGPVADTHINNGYPDFVKLHLDTLDGYDGNAVAVQKGNTELLTVINQVIDDLNQQGLIVSWLSQYSE